MTSGKCIWWPRDLRPWGTMAAALAVSTFFSWDLGDSLLSIPHSRGLGLVQWGACFLIFLWGCNAAPGALDVVVSFGGAALGTFAVLQRAVGVSRDHIGIWSPVLLGELLIVGFPLAYRRGRGLAFCFFAGACAAQCRSALIAMAAMTLYFYWSNE